jgi:hypothetical protein
MNTQEAKLILRSYRPESAEAGDAHYVEALGMVETDAELRAWFEREQEFNRMLVAGQEQIAVPAGLRERLLTARSRPVWRRPAWWGVAAAFVVLGAIAAVVWPRPQQPVANSALAAFVLADAQHPKTHGGHGAEEAAFKASLKQTTTRLGTQSPDFPSLRESGCRTLQHDGRDVLEVCFKRNGAGLHFYIARREDFPALVAGSTPVVVDNPAGHLVVWADQAYLYIVVTNLERAQLEKLL